MRETVKDIDILVTSIEPARVIDTFVSLPSILEVSARDGRLPALVTRAAIRGDLHAHTDASDGHHSLEHLIEAAQARGYEYIIVSDHSKSATVARGLGADELGAQIARIRALQPRYRIRILAGSECDVLGDGTLDFPDDTLRELDLVLAAVHSRFKQPRPEMTARIVRALANPYVNILAHPTGRLLGARDPYDVDLDAVFEAARAHGKALEINASPERLDLNDVHARRAATRLKCNPDAPQRLVRLRALSEGKLVFMAVPRLREERCFLRLDPAKLGHRVAEAATIAGAARLGEPVPPESLGAIDLVIVGSVAVSPDGARVGKGGGYSDLEFALARELGAVGADTPVATTVHELQMLDEPLPMTDHDVPLDLIATPERVIRTRRTLPKPKGIHWEELSPE